MVVLLMGALLLRYWIASLDPFLNDWDEKFHAVVARNLTYHWLRPTLIDQPYLAYDFEKWSRNYIWLHKQPLFLWQIALSIKLFGPTIFAVRLPSILLTAILVVIVYDIAVLCFDTTVAYIAAFLFSFYQPILEMNSGFGGMEHNTIAFIFYNTLAIWAWLRYEKTRNKTWMLLVGIYSGMAILNKWLIGLLVFSGYSMYHLLFKKNLFTKEIFFQLLMALGSCLLIMLPWQVYILWCFPAEAMYEFSYNSRHFSEVLEGHRAYPMFYIDQLKVHYKMIQSLIFIGFAFAFASVPKRDLRLTLFLMCSLIYAFFTLAATKLDEYVLIVAPLLLIFMSFAIVQICHLLFTRFMDYKIPTAIFMLLSAVLLFDYSGICKNHSFTDNNWHEYYRKKRLSETAWIHSHFHDLQPNDVIVSCPFNAFIDVMFYTGHTAYGVLDSSQTKQLTQMNKHLIYWD